MEAPFTRSELVQLAVDVLALDCPAKSQVHAEKMLSVKKDEYSRSFFEAATRIGDLKEMGFTLNEAVMAVAGAIPDVENIDFKVKWWDLDIVRVTKSELYAIAAVIEEYEIPSPDSALAHKIHTNKATKEEWRLFALRYVDFKSRISDFDILLWEFCSDINRTKNEIAALKPWISKARPSGDSYDVERPVLPPWRDTEYWDADLDEWGYGDDFSPTFEPMSSFDIVPTDQTETDTHPAYTDSVVDNALIEEEEYEVAVLDGDVLEDEELYAAQDVEKKRLLEDAVNLPNHLLTNHLSARTVKNFPQIVSNATFLTAHEKEQRAADSVMLTEAMQFSSFKEELRACEEAMKRDPDGKLLDRALTRLLDSQEKIEALELAAHNNNESLLAVVTHTGSDFAGPSTIKPLTTSPPDNLDVNAYSQLIAPLESEEEWPALSSEKTVPDVQQKTQATTANTQPVKNVWTEKHKAKKIYMNAGIGGKLTHVLPTTSEFFVDVHKAPTVQDIWGFSLLGQYVGHNPGHYLINAMIKSWGVRAKYKMEEGWFIFTFESEHDQEKVLIGGPYLIHGRPLLLKNIPDKFAFNRKDLALVPLWVRIYGLASRFWTPGNLGGIASYVGCPMYMDPVTDGRKRNAYARVLVEVNLAAPITKKVHIQFSDGDKIEVNFLIENQPKFCTDCCSYGHDCNSCQFESKKAAKATEEGLQGSSDKPHGKDSVAQDNSQPTPLFSTQTVNLNAVNSSQPATLDMIVYRGEEQLQQTEVHGTEQPAEEGEIIGHTTHHKDAHQANVSGELAEVHSDFSLMNKFAALKDTTELPTLSNEPGTGAHATINSETTNKQLETFSELTKQDKAHSTKKGNGKQVANGHMATKAASSTPSNKLSNSSTWHTVGPNTRSRKKAQKP